jgi:hypothetical protein
MRDTLGWLGSWNPHRQKKESPKKKIRAKKWKEKKGVV